MSLFYFNFPCFISAPLFYLANVVIIEGRASIVIWARLGSVRQAYGSL